MVLRMSESVEGDWIGAAAASELARQRTGSSLHKQILERARDGIIRARAAEYIVDGPVRERASSTFRHRREVRHSQYDIPREFFWAGSDDAMQANWTTGDFSTWIDHTWHCRAFGVQFLRAEIIAMTPVVPRTPVSADALASLPKHTIAETEHWIRSARSHLGISHMRFTSLIQDTTGSSKASSEICGCA